ncbi:MAG: hypothetical protein J3R72DRAFT_452079 [Linnemannia gamsii]|nr:MAG: hypothetical protein J3R72DRAFT_452079 [Linnemannia gamsii]
MIRGPVTFFFIVLSFSLHHLLRYLVLCVFIGVFLEKRVDGCPRCFNLAHSKKNLFSSLSVFRLVFFLPPIAPRPFVPWVLRSIFFFRCAW